MSRIQYLGCILAHFTLELFIKLYETFKCSKCSRSRTLCSSGPDINGKLCMIMDIILSSLCGILVYYGLDQRERDRSKTKETFKPFLTHLLICVIEQLIVVNLAAGNRSLTWNYILWPFALLCISGILLAVYYHWFHPESPFKTMGPKCLRKDSSKENKTCDYCGHSAESQDLIEKKSLDKSVSAYFHSSINEMKLCCQNSWNCCKKKETNDFEDPKEMEHFVNKKESHPERQSNGFVQPLQFIQIELGSSNSNSITSEMIEEDSVTTSPDTTTLEDPPSLINPIVNQIIDRTLETAKVTELPDDINSKEITHIALVHSASTNGTIEKKSEIEVLVEKKNGKITHNGSHQNGE